MSRPSFSSLRLFVGVGVAYNVHRGSAPSVLVAVAVGQEMESMSMELAGTQALLWYVKRCIGKLVGIAWPTSCWIESC